MTDSGLGTPVSDNVLKGEFTKALPNKAWVSGVTCSRTRNGRLHLTLGNLSPIAFEHQMAIAKPAIVSEIT